MIIIGEKLNTSIQKTMEAVQNRDEEALIALIRAQEEAGADYQDVNAAVGGDELAGMQWLAGLVLKHSHGGIMLDSPSTEVIEDVIKKVGERPVIVNSVTLSERLSLLPAIFEAGAAVVGLPMDGGGIPRTAEGRKKNAERLVDKITAAGIPPEKIFIDVLAESAAVADENLMIALSSIPLINAIDPGIKTVCGVSNVSFGLPGRVNINCAFLSAAVAAGLQSAILDITSPAVKTALLSSLAVVGRDEYCLNYIAHMRGMKG
jgi:5-methyltetrahydrofolate--homocysteine methyltransferase